MEFPPKWHLLWILLLFTCICIVKYLSTDSIGGIYYLPQPVSSREKYHGIGHDPVFGIMNEIGELPDECFR